MYLRGRASCDYGRNQFHISTLNMSHNNCDLELSLSVRIILKHSLPKYPLRFTFTNLWYERTKLSRFLSYVFNHIYIYDSKNLCCSANFCIVKVNKIPRVYHRLAASWTGTSGEDYERSLYLNYFNRTGREIYKETLKFTNKEKGLVTLLMSCRVEFKVVFAHIYSALSCMENKLSIRNHWDISHQRNR